MYLYYRIDKSSLGKNKTLATNSCKQIKETECSTGSRSSGVHWLWKKQPMQVFSYIAIASYMMCKLFIYITIIFRFTVI